MARMLASYLTLSLIISSCASIRPLDSRKTSEKKTSQQKITDKDIQLENIAAFEEIYEVDPKTIQKPKNVKVAVVDKELIQAEEEILKTYEKEDLKKEDPVSTVAESEAPFVLDYKQKHYKFWLNYFSKRESERFERHVKNGLKFKKVVESILEEEGLPKDLFYVGLIESGYNTHIRSHASAVGPWQFIKGTAKRYNLRVDSQLDERRNIFKSTRAAANYFKDLYNIFGSWELALCAYNAGEYRIINAIRKGNTRDYKELVAKKLLPKETIFYIPKVAAAKDLILRKYGHLKETSKASVYQEATEIEINKGVSLKRLAKSLKISTKLLKTLNPDFRNDYISKRRRGHRLFVPTNVAKLAATNIKSFPKGESYRRVATQENVHRVAKGESLYKIARMYNTTIRKIKKDNRLRRNRIFVGQKLKVRGPLEATTYRVRKGDNLSTIAAKFNIGLNDLRGFNGLSKNKIFIGQKLKLKSSGKRVYVVRRGDNLYRIARKFGLSVKRIVQANSLKDKRIFPKQKIILPI